MWSIINEGHILQNSTLDIQSDTKSRVLIKETTSHCIYILNQFYVVAVSTNQRNGSFFVLIYSPVFRLVECTPSSIFGKYLQNETNVYLGFKIGKRASFSMEMYTILKSTSKFCNVLWMNHISHNSQANQLDLDVTTRTGYPPFTPNPPKNHKPTIGHPPQSCN